jgi:hypothetical protein
MGKDACGSCGCCNHCNARHEQSEHTLEECPLDPETPQERIDQYLRDAGCDPKTGVRKVTAMVEVMQENERLRWWSKWWHKVARLYKKRYTVAHWDAGESWEMVAELEKRRDALLLLVRQIDMESVTPEQAQDLNGQIRALIAEVGTLRSKCKRMEAGDGQVRAERLQIELEAEQRKNARLGAGVARDAEKFDEKDNQIGALMIRIGELEQSLRLRAANHDDACSSDGLDWHCVPDCPSRKLHELEREGKRNKELAALWERACHDFRAQSVSHHADPLSYSLAVAFAHERVVAVVPADAELSIDVVLPAPMQRIALTTEVGPESKMTAAEMEEQYKKDVVRHSGELKAAWDETKEWQAVVDAAFIALEHGRVTLPPRETKARLVQAIESFREGMPYPDNPGKTHWDGCYVQRGHHNCAVRKINEMKESGNV